MNRKYIVTLHNDFTSPYFYTEDNEQCNHVTHESYSFTSLKMCKQCVKDFLDVPEAELTFEATKKEWSDSSYKISDAKIKEIQTYYNGRLGIYNKLIKDIEDNELSKSTDALEIKYDIPHEFNEFVVDEKEKLSTQNEAYISVTIEPVL